MTHDERSIGRRRLLLVAAGAVGLLGASACNKGPSSCTDERGLSPDDVTLRRTLAYVDRSQDPNLSCEKCVQYLPGSAGACGGCKVMKGPVHPQGTCRVFTRA